MSGLAIVASFAVLAFAAVLRPHAARCPGNMDLRTGVRADGSFQCWPHPVGDPNWDGTYGRPDRSVQASWVLAGRVYCASTERPSVVDWNLVGCRRER